MRFWLRVFAVAFSTAALIGAAQLGLAYGLSAIRFDRPFDGAVNDWNVQLTWIAWFTLTAVVGGTAFALSFGRMLARRIGMTSRHTDGTSVTARIVAAAAAGLGGLLAMLPLTVYPASNTKGVPTNAAITMALGVAMAAVAGAILASVAVANRPMSTGLVAFSVAVWALAVFSIVRTLPLMGWIYNDPARLGVLDVGELQPGPRAMYTMPALALLLGLVIALVARARRQSRVLTALSGATGPLLVAVAYLVAGPGLVRDLTNQADAYLGAMAAVLAGLVPSIIVALLPQRPKPVL